MKVQVDIELTTEQMAETFIHWGNDEQAKFLNEVGKHFNAAKFDSELQMCYIADHVDNNGAHFLYTVSNFNKAKGITDPDKSSRLLNVYETVNL